MSEHNYNNYDDWQAPISFDDYTAPTIPISLLPSNLQTYAGHLIKSAEVDSGMVVMGCFSVLSTMFSSHYVVSPREGWQEPVNIYTLTALPPASNKSLVVKSLSSPLITWEKERFEDQREHIKSQESQRKTEEVIINRLRNAAAKIKNKNEQMQIMEEINKRERNLIKPDIPIKLFANNVTPESLIDEVDDQGGKFALISDEGGLLETLSGLYTKGTANIDVLLKGYDGGDLRIKRKNDERSVNPYLTIWLVVQPKIISNIAEKKAYEGNGFMERFLYLIPQSNLGYRKHEDYIIPANDKAHYYDVIRKLLDTVYENKSTQPTILTLAPDANDAWKAFRIKNESELRPNGRLENCKGWGGKICGTALRLAGLIHLCEHETNDTVISLNSINKALALADFLKEHAVAAFGFMGSDQAMNDAKELSEWVKNWQRDCFTKSDVSHALRNRKVGKKARLDKALDELIERHYLVSAADLSNNGAKKPTAYYYINPQIR